MTVFIAHESRNALDLTPAEEFGDIQFVFTREFSPGFNPKEAAIIAESVLEGFDFDNDYFLIAGGDPIAGMIASMVLADFADPENDQVLKTLRYTKDFDAEGVRSIPRYIPIEVSI